MSEKVCLILCVILMLSTPVQLRYCSRYTRALDVVFVLDSSPDISDDDWELITKLSRDAAYQLHASTSGTHIAQVHFSSKALVVHRLDAEFQANYNRPGSFQTGRNLSDALDTTRRLVLNSIDGDRPEVPDVIVLITHGLCDDKISAISKARSLKSEGIRIFTVGMTSTQVDQLREELREISTDPDDVDSLMLINRNYYSPVFSYLVQSMCRNRVEAANESLRLVDGTSHTGRLEVYINEEWVTVCSTSWTYLNTETACRQLGFPAGQNMYLMNQTSYYRRVGVANIKCSGYETSLLKCPHDPFFQIDPSCDHQRDVFLRCLCGECNDYVAADNVRLVDGTSISGRLEVFSPRLGWGGVCSVGWTAFSTRVACRQLGFFDGAGTYQPNQNRSITLVLFHVSCSGNESALFDCTYTATSTETRTNPVYIRCECHNCIEFLLQVPQQKYAMTQSSAAFEWHLKDNVTAFEFLFLSQKNPQTLMYVEEGKVTKEHTGFRHRIQLINVDYETVGFKLINITVADMGTYSLRVPNRLLDSQAVLIVTDFAVVPDPVVHGEINDTVVLSWDLSALRRLRGISHELILTTPATGRIHLDYYTTHWITNNPHYHSVPQPTDDFHPTIMIDGLTPNDAGNYGLEIILTASIYQWLNFSGQFVTYLVVDDNLTEFDNTTHRIMLDKFDYTRGVSTIIVVIIVLGILLGVSVLVNIGLIPAYCMRSKKVKQLETKMSLPMCNRNHRQTIANLRARIIEATDQGYVPEPGTEFDNDSYTGNGSYDDGDIDIQDPQPQPPPQGLQLRRVPPVPPPQEGNDMSENDNLESPAPSLPPRHNYLTAT